MHVLKIVDHVVESSLARDLVFEIFSVNKRRRYLQVSEVGF